MLDYKLLEALASVIDEGGFEKAAEKLFISQSAVSQRIRQLEMLQGQVLISRENPPIPTVAGQALLKHYRQVRTLEENLGVINEKKPLPIGINADSLATWFLPLLEPLLKKSDFSLEIKVDDQDETSLMLKKGVVAGCISSSEHAVQGCRVHYLGKMDYFPVASRTFFETWFAKGMTTEALEIAPAVIFNRKDKLHEKYLEAKFQFTKTDYPRSYIPSSEKFVEHIKLGASYGIVPQLQIDDSLIKLHKFAYEVPLYWHHWNIESEKIINLTEILLKRSSEYIK